MTAAPYVPPGSNVGYPGVVAPESLPGPAYTPAPSATELGIMQGMATGVGGTTEVLAGVTAVNNQLAGVQTADGLVPAEGFLGCLTGLAQSALSITSFYSGQSASSTKLSAAMTKPITDTYDLFKDILIPNNGATGGPTSGSSVLDTMINSVTDALSDPLTAIFKLQQATLQQSLGTLYDATIQPLSPDSNPADQSLITQYVDQVMLVGKSLFFSPNAEGNMRAIYLFAFKHGIPAIDTELTYLKQIRGAVSTCFQQASFIPAQIDVSLANTSLLNDLCIADRDLRIVSRKLRTQGVFDRATLQDATAHVCHAKDTIYTGATDSLESFIGINGIKVTDLQAFLNSSLAQVLPGINFRLACAELQFLRNQLKIEDQYILTLYNNIINAVALLKSLEQLPLGEMLSLIINVIQMQISALRIQLESGDPAGSLNQITAQAAANKDIATYIKQQGEALVTTTASQDQLQQFYVNVNNYARQRLAAANAIPAQPKTDVWTYISSMVGAYSILAVLCPLMNTIPKIFNIIQDILDVQQGFAAELQAIIDLFDVTPCGDPQGGAVVITLIDNFLLACQNHSNRRSIDDPSNAINSTTDLQAAATALNIAIKQRETFLYCMKSHLGLGIGQLEVALSVASDAVAIEENIAGLATQFSDLYETLKTADLSRLLGTNGQSSSALDTLIKAVQCLVLNCDNPVISKIANNVLNQVQDSYDIADSQTISMGTFDGIPAVGKKCIDNDRLQRLLNVIDQINQLLNLDFSTLCTTPTNAPGSVTATQTQANQTAYINRGNFQAVSQKYYDYDGSDSAPTPPTTLGVTTPTVNLKGN